METWVSVAGFGGGGVLAAACAYKILRPRFPVRVNCWFCNGDTVVPYGNRNCWDCPGCEQYNGFDKAGDYNKDIPAQHMSDLNHGIGCSPEEYLGSSSALCNGCEENQLLKVKQLASFVPMNEDNYDVEIDAYKDHLERVYELCDPCKVTVEHELMKQDDALRAKLHANTSDTSNTSQTSHMDGLSELSSSTYGNAGDLLGLTSLLCACLVLAYSLAQYPSMLSDVWPLLTFAETMRPYQQALHYTGLGLCLMSKILIGKDRLFLVDVVVSVTWILCAAVVTRDITLLSPRLVDDKVLTVLFGVNLLMSLASCIITRTRTTATTQTFKRLSLDKSTGSYHSEAETVAISSVSTSRRARPDPEPVSEVKEERLDDLDLEMEAFSLGSKPTQMKRSDSGMFSMTGSQASFTSLSAVPRPLLGQPRPLISPARLRVTSSTPTDIFNRTSSGPTLHMNPAFDSRSRQSLQFPKLPNQAPDNPFLEQSLTTERLSLFNAQISGNTAVQRPWQRNKDSEASSTRQFDVSVSEQSSTRASPLRNSCLWQHAKFGQTHLSPDKLAQCKFTSQNPQGSPKQAVQTDVYRGPSRPNTPIRKSLWQQNIMQELDNQGSVPVIENNVFQRTDASTVKSTDMRTEGSCVLTPSTLVSSLGDGQLRQRHVQSVEEETSLVKDDSTKSSDCLVDSTVIIEPSKPSNLKMLGIGAVLLASVLGNAVLVGYLYTNS
ncbi:transmembrane protein 201-like [Haliotis cracherodii]|uniref:transmembrane protein 201-like n=1 Tax=Haliotis cracherodii TaxID=6455 RepID=UPI0039EC64AF